LYIFHFKVKVNGQRYAYESLAIASGIKIAFKVRNKINRGYVHISAISL
jgi:hypothetical protein